MLALNQAYSANTQTENCIVLTSLSSALNLFSSLKLILQGECLLDTTRGVVHGSDCREKIHRLSFIQISMSLVLQEFQVSRLVLLYLWVEMFLQELSALIWGQLVIIRTLLDNSLTQWFEVAKFSNLIISYLPKMLNSSLAILRNRA